MSDEDFGRFERSPRWRDEGYRRPYTGRFAGRQDSASPARTAATRALSAADRRLWPRLRRPHGAAAAPLRGRRRTTTAITASGGQRQLDELDRDYDDYARENRSRFEDDFTSWREQTAGASASCSARSASIWKSSAATASMSAPSTASPATA